MYHAEWMASHPQRQPLPAVIRNYREADFDALIHIQRECFPPPFPQDLWWTKEQLASHVGRFPAGALCAEADGELVGSMTGLIIQYDPHAERHSWAEVTGEGSISTHNPAGDTLYIVDISVRPAYRQYGIGKAMTQAMYHLVIHHRLKRLLGGARLSGYHRYAQHMSAEEYANLVVSGQLIDPVVTFLLRCGRVPVKVVENYLEDEESHHYALLMEWRNPFEPQ
jgi:ribosomal protein S18 acetylase RimI-like enzyme